MKIGPSLAQQKSTVYRNYLINPRIDLCTRIDMVPQSSKPYYLTEKLTPISANSYFADRFPRKNITYTFSGTEAIALTLSQLSLQADDVISILTTTQNFYISSCVTKTIESYCRWSREVQAETKAIYVNHEFGFPYAELSTLKNLGLPIIEDCAYAFSANNPEGSVGKIGDYIIFSLPKFFPMQLGGILLSEKPINSSMDIRTQNHIEKQLQLYLPQIEHYSAKRRELYYLYSEMFSSLPNTKPRFELRSHDVPGAFLFHVPDFVDLDEMKRFFKRQGVESSVFYGERVYFLPLHQNLSKSDIEYLHALTEYCYKEMSNTL